MAGCLRFGVAMMLGVLSAMGTARAATVLRVDFATRTVILTLGKGEFPLLLKNDHVYVSDSSRRLFVKMAVQKLSRRRVTLSGSEEDLAAFSPKSKVTLAEESSLPQVESPLDERLAP